MKKRIILYICCIFVTQMLYSQIAIPHRVTTPKPADSIDIAYYSQKNGWRAASMSFGLNVGLWAFDRYVLKADYAYINARTMKANLKKGFIWDNDLMGTNMFLHPYHGSLYFNSARSNGYNFWQSGLFAFGGSAMWELFMECEYPSANDILATPIGGMALGEVFYRMSDLTLDDRRTGFSRFGHELASFIISPARGVTRLLTGDAWKVRRTSGKQFGKPEVSLEVSAGLRALELKDDIFDKGIGVATQINMEYGDRFDTDKNRPYDYFSFKAHLNIQASQPLLGQLNMVGRLWGTDVVDKKNSYLNFGVYQHFDYYDSDTISTVSSQIPYKFCTPASVGIGAMYKTKLLKNWDLDAYAHFTGIILGGALSDYYRVEDRNYNLASGFSGKSGFNFVYEKDKLAISTTYEVYRMFTWKGYAHDIDWDNIDSKSLNAQGDKSQAVLHAIGIRMDVKLMDQLYLTGSYYNYTRDTNYKYFDNVFSQTSEGKLLLTYKF